MKFCGSSTLVGTVASILSEVAAFSIKLYLILVNNLSGQDARNVLWRI